MRAHRVRSLPWPPFRPQRLCQHGLRLEVLGWLTLLVALAVFLFATGPAGHVTALVLTVLGVAEVCVGIDWRARSGR